MTKDTDDRDLFCLKCGYNLRGLPGDPRRCPECGHENAVADLLVPAKRITKALRNLETGPGMATAALAALLLWLLPLLVAMLQQPRVSPIAWGAVITGIAACIAAYVAGVRKFRTTCRGQPEWTSALVRHHLFGLLTALCLIIFLVACVLLIVTVAFSRGRISLLQECIGAGIGLIAFGGTWLFGRLAKRSIVPLQRACAAAWAREHASRFKR